MGQGGSSSLIETASAATCLAPSFNLLRLHPQSPLLSIPFHVHDPSHITPISKYGRRPESVAATGGALSQDSATKQITDIGVLQQAETSLQKASGGFSFFGGKQEKCTVWMMGFGHSYTDARDRRGSRRPVYRRSKCLPDAKDG